MKRIIYLLVAAIGLLVGCTPEEETGAGRIYYR